MLLPTSVLAVPLNCSVRPTTACITLFAGLMITPLVALITAVAVEGMGVLPPEPPPHPLTHRQTMAITPNTRVVFMGASSWFVVDTASRASHRPVSTALNADYCVLV